jgi:hypothetical protein
MPKTLQAAKPKKRTVQQLATELDGLRERVEDLEDLRDLREAVKRNGDKPLIPWSRAKKELGID